MQALSCVAEALCQRDASRHIFHLQVDNMFNLRRLQGREARVSAVSFLCLLLGARLLLPLDGSAARNCQRRVRLLAHYWERSLHAHFVFICDGLWAQTCGKKRGKLLCLHSFPFLSVRLDWYSFFFSKQFAILMTLMIFLVYIEITNVILVLCFKFL